MPHEMAGLKVLYGFIAGGFGVGDTEPSKELDVCIFSLKAEAIPIIGENMGTKGPAEFILVGLNALGDNNSMRCGNRLGFFFCKAPFDAEAEINIAPHVTVK